MDLALDHPLFLFAASVPVLWFSAWLGSSVLRRKRTLEEGFREDLGVILAAALTLLALIIGFCFSMAIARYDLRKTYEEAEVNAISTELVRADLLPAADAARVRTLIGKNVDERILFYTPHDVQELRQVNDRTAKLQEELWSAVATPAMVHSPTVSLSPWPFRG